MPPNEGESKFLAAIPSDIPYEQGFWKPGRGICNMLIGSETDTTIVPDVAQHLGITYAQAHQVEYWRARISVPARVRRRGVELQIGSTCVCPWYDGIALCGKDFRPLQ